MVYTYTLNSSISRNLLWICFNIVKFYIYGSIQSSTVCFKGFDTTSQSMAERLNQVWHVYTIDMTMKKNRAAPYAPV